MSTLSYTSDKTNRWFMIELQWNCGAETIIENKSLYNYVKNIIIHNVQSWAEFIISVTLEGGKKTEVNHSKSSRRQRFMATTLVLSERVSRSTGVLAGHRRS